MRPSSGQINVAASAPKIHVDDRFSLRFYCRIADNILKQADIFRAEKNIIDLYIMLLRFTSLAMETIPCHRNYSAFPEIDKVSLKKKLLKALNELEGLKPIVRQKINDLSRKHMYQPNDWTHQSTSSDLSGSSLEWPKSASKSYKVTKALPAASQGYLYQVPQSQQFSYARPSEEQVRRLSLNTIRPKEETLSRHSILGPNGLRGQWQAPTSNLGVNYPTIIDLTPIEIPRENISLRITADDVSSSKDSSSSHLRITADDVSSSKDSSSSHLERSSLESIHQPDKDNQTNVEEPGSLISFDVEETPVQAEIVRQPTPPPVLADVQDLVPTVLPPVKETGHGMPIEASDALVCSESPLQLHFSTAIMDSFMKMAKSNTDKNLETCGILAGSLKNRKFHVTALIIPKQESTSDSCQTTNEEEIFEVQDKQSLFPLGWIHTHPTQSCFMSSIDLHTHYSYQIMLPEAIAIVMAPKDSSRKHGIFRLTTPGGMGVIRQCPRRGFHPHDPPSDGSPIYKQCTDVYMNPKLKFDVIDLR